MRRNLAVQRYQTNTKQCAGTIGHVFFTHVALAKAGLVVGPLHPMSVCMSVHPSVHLFVHLSARMSVPKTLGCQVCIISNSKSVHSFFIQTLPNDFLHIEDVHLLLSAGFIFFSFWGFVEPKHFFNRQCLGGT